MLIELFTALLCDRFFWGSYDTTSNVFSTCIKVAGHNRDCQRVLY